MYTFWQDFYSENKLNITNFRQELESSEYVACDVFFEGKNAKFRIAKITPKKVGQFVTLWKRENGGPIQPFSVLDPIDFVIIAVNSGTHLGHFIFPKKILAEKGIFSNKKEGKRAFRVYPPWDSAKNMQAIKTQKWQLAYFADFTNFEIKTKKL